jgi:predicted RNA-binding Zn ribbon-like protein
MEKRSIEIKNYVHKTARAEKLKGQCNENFLFVEWLIIRHVSRIWSNMSKCGADNQSLTYKKSRGTKLKGRT